MKALVDFIVAGAPKCGTTALWHFLDQHPEVFLSQNKEPRFFTAEKGTLSMREIGVGPRLSGNYTKGLKWYKALFKGAKSNQIKGEASTLYFCNYDAAELIKNHNPEVKLIFMLRDPVMRLYSHYWQEYKLGYDFPSFQEMVINNHPRFEFYKKVSSYEEHLKRYFSLFSEENILILIQEEFVKNPEKNFNKVLDFLQIKPLSGIDFNKRYNVQRVPKNRNVSKFLVQLQSSTLKGFLPGMIVRKLGKVRKKIANRNSVELNYDKISELLYFELKKEFVSDENYVSNLLNRKITEWDYRN